jgi:hypothetical protein
VVAGSKPPYHEPMFCQQQHSYVLDGRNKAASKKQSKIEETVV